MKKVSFFHKSQFSQVLKNIKLTTAFVIQDSKFSSLLKPFFKLGLPDLHLPTGDLELFLSCFWSKDEKKVALDAYTSYAKYCGIELKALIHVMEADAEQIIIFTICIIFTNGSEASSKIAPGNWLN